jgi:hypothetical protein
LQNKVNQHDFMHLKAESETIQFDPPKNIFVYLTTEKLRSFSKCFFESLLSQKKITDHKLTLYYKNNNVSKFNENFNGLLKNLTSAYEGISLNATRFKIKEDLIETNISSILKFKAKTLEKLNNPNLIDKYVSKLKPMIQLWLNGGVFFTSYFNKASFEHSTQTRDETFSFVCDDDAPAHAGNKKQHKNCSIDFIKVNRNNCILLLAIKNYLLHYQVTNLLLHFFLIQILENQLIHYQVNQYTSLEDAFMNLYYYQRKMLSSKKKINQESIYIQCFKSKLKVTNAKSLDHYFQFNSNSPDSNIDDVNISMCPILNSFEI